MYVDVDALMLRHVRFLRYFGSESASAQFVVWTPACGSSFEGMPPKRIDGGTEEEDLGGGVTL